MAWIFIPAYCFAIDRTKLYLTKTFTADDKYWSDQAQFIRENDLDVSYDFSTNYFIEGFVPNVLSLVDPTKKPWGATLWVFWAAHFTILGALPYRMWPVMILQMIFVD